MSAQRTAPSGRRLRIEIGGAVQGVGFRPFVYQCAQKLGLAGWVENTASGVRLEVEGDADRIAALLRTIRESPPPNAVVTSLEVHELDWRADAAFLIRTSDGEGARTAQILPDLASCDDCLRELFDPADRRYLYPFVNCTQCGPRHSIVERLPYDRANTSMRHFPMCPKCQAEYDDPSNRRFHAEPNACPDCGPRIAVWDGSGAALARDHDALLAAAAAIRAGKIVALKGLGGFHLIADARNEAAVALLRSRKQRPARPFAVMFPSLKAITRDCDVSPAQTVLLEGPAHPIVLVRGKPGTIAPGVAPGNPWLGIFLPYTPLHHLLLGVLGFPIVATSGNLADEPIAIDEAEALERLAGIADLFLVHDRIIVRAIDDSVVRVVCGRDMVLRRARGYAPASIAVDGVPAGILALGGHMKTTVAMTLENAVVVGQHIGDLETVAARAAHQCAMSDMMELRGVAPRLVVRDLHPDYATTRLAGEMGPPVVAVQHHLAHVVACMAENAVAPPVLGVAWDGTGYGPDGTIWGGEFLLVTADGWRRIAHLRTFALPGGEAAVRTPRRAALGLLYEAFGEDAFAMDELPALSGLSLAERDVIRSMLRQKVNAPRTSSMGRLFDGFASLCGLRQTASYEGQAAAEFEWAATAAPTAYEFPLRDGDPWTLDWQPALDRLLADRRENVPIGAISAAFHDGLAAAIVAVARRAGEPRVVLTGGCFQNARLTESSVATLGTAGFKPLWHRAVPPNDGGIALGQAVWAAWNEGKGSSCA